MFNRYEIFKLFAMRYFFLSLCLLLSWGYLEAENNPISPALTLGLTSSDVYDINLIDGSVVVRDTLITEPFGVTLLNPTNAIIAAFDHVYNFNLTTGTTSILATISGSLAGAALVNDTTLITVGTDNGKVYSVNLATGTSSVITTLEEQLTTVVLLDLSTALVTNTTLDKLYRINLSNGEFTTITVPGSNLFDIAVLNPNQVIGVGDFGGNVYSIDLTTGQFSVVAEVDASELTGIALVDPSTAIIVSFQRNKVYEANLNTGQTREVTPFSQFLAGFNHFALAPRIFTSSLTNNNLAFAKYLNVQAPYSLIRLFNLQSDINNALERAAPTRNAFSTFAAQTTQLLSAQPLANHFNQFRLNKKAAKNTPVAAHALPTNELLADNQPLASGKTESVCRNGNTYTPWIEFFGDLASEKAQSQTPAFSAASGGVLAAFDYNQLQSPCPAPIGFGLAYAYTHLHQDENMGHARLNQGAVVAYGEFSQSKWYFDLALWGGYYHADNERKIVFPGFSGKATSNVSGWQLSPHFEIGYDFCYEEEPRENFWFGIEPFAMADWVSTWEGSLRESGTDGVLDFGQNGRWASMLRAEAGLRFNEQLTYGWGTVSLREKASYAYQKAFGTGSITTFLIGTPGTFNVTTLATAQNLAIAAFELLFRPRCTNYPYGSIAYQGEFGSKYMSNQIMLTLGMNF